MTVQQCVDSHIEMYTSADFYGAASFISLIPNECKWSPWGNQSIHIVCTPFQKGTLQLLLGQVYPVDSIN